MWLFLGGVVTGLVLGALAMFFLGPLLVWLLCNH